MSIALSTEVVAETVEVTEQEVMGEDQGKRRRDPWCIATFRASTEEVGPAKEWKKKILRNKKRTRKMDCPRSKRRESFEGEPAVKQVVDSVKG